MSNQTTDQLVEMWGDHQESRPDAPDDYLANIQHLRQVMGRWTATDEAFRTLVGHRMATAALEEELERRNRR